MDSFSINMTNKFFRPGKFYVSLSAGQKRMMQVKKMVDKPVISYVPDTEKPKKPTIDPDNSDIPDEDLSLDENNNSTSLNATNTTSTPKMKEVITYEQVEEISEKEEFVVSFSNQLNVLVSSKIKLNYLKCVITNSGSKEDGKELQIEHPKRSFKELKGTQSSVMKIKLKVNKYNNLK